MLQENKQRPGHSGENHNALQQKKYSKIIIPVLVMTQFCTLVDHSLISHLTIPNFPVSHSESYGVGFVLLSR